MNKHLYFFQGGGFYPMPQQQYVQPPFLLPLQGTYQPYNQQQMGLDPTQFGQPALNLNSNSPQFNPPQYPMLNNQYFQPPFNAPISGNIYLPQTGDKNANLASPGNYNDYDIDNNQIPDYIQAPTSNAPLREKRGQNPNQQIPPWMLYSQMYPYGITQGDHYARAGRAAAILGTKDKSQVFGKNQYFKNPKRAERAGTVGAGISLGANLLSGFLGSARDFLGGMGQQKLAMFQQQQMQEDLRKGMIPQYYGQQQLFNNGWQQQGNFGFIEDGGMFKDGGKYNPWAICTASVGRKDKAKYERCVMQVKGKHEDGGCACGGDCYKCGGKKKYEDGGDVEMSKLATGSYTTGVEQDPYAKKEPVVNAEVERGEFIKDGETGEISEVLGDNHESGGEKLQLSGNSQILSNNVLLAKNDVKYLKDELDVKASTKDTYADGYKKSQKKVGLTELNEKQEKSFEQLKKNDKKVKDENTKKLNESFISEKIFESEQEKKPLEIFLQSVFEDLYDRQEKNKQSSSVKKENDSNVYEDGGEYDLDEATIKKLENEGFILERM